MQYFFVFQNKSYEQERQGGYLWAPQGSPSHWKSMLSVQKGDMIFHCHQQHIVAISIAQTDCYEAPQPDELARLQLWEQEGWKVDTQYHLLKFPFRPMDYEETVLHLQPPRYAPFNRQGRGNTGYLFRLTPELAQFFLETAAILQPDIINPIIDQMGGSTI